MNEHDARVADMLDKIGHFVGSIAPAFGEKGVLAATGVRAITNTAAHAIRSRGATTDEIVQALKKIGALRTPWPGLDGKIKDPA